MGQLVSQSSNVVQPKKKDSSSQSREALNAFKSFETILRALIAAIKGGTKADVSKLVEARTLLLEALANSDVAERLPLLQKFVRSDVLLLIHSVQSAKAVTESLKKQVVANEMNLEKVVAEVNSIERKDKPFWQLNV